MSLIWSFTFPLFSSGKTNLKKDTKKMPINVVHNNMIYLTENSD